MIISILVKNLKILFRNPLIVLLIILTPLFLMLLVGITYSGETVSGINIGLIGAEEDFFKYNGINIKTYSTENLQSSKSKCISDMRNSVMDLCVYLDLVKDMDGNTKGGKIEYYVDNTRPKLNELTIRILDSLIEEEIGEISKKTIDDIFQEITETTNFVEENKLLLDNVEKNLTLIKNNFVIFKKFYKSNKEEIKEDFDDLKLLKNKLVNNLNDLEKNRILTKNSISELDNNLLNLKENFNSYRKNLNSLKGEISYFYFLYPNSTYYIDNIFFNEMESDLNNIENQINKVSILIGDLDIYIDKISITDLENELNQIFGEIENFLEQIKELEDEILNVENLLIEKEKEVKLINEELDARLKYFKGLSQRNSNEITQPIERNTFYLFNNFKMIHQIAPTIVILTILFVGILFSNVLVSLEIDSKANLRNILSPVPQWKFVFSIFLTSLIIVLFQVAFLMLILYINFGISNIFDNFFYLLFTIFHLLVIFILIGIFCAYFFESMQISILISVFLILSLFLLSDIIITSKVMPDFVKLIVFLNPVVFGETILRKLFFFEFKFDFYFILISLIMYIYIFILIILIYIANLKRYNKLF